MKLVHAADLHLDSPLRGLERYEGAPVETLRGATRRALENLVALCLDEGASLLLIAGDLFDGDWRDFSTGLFFADQMSRLRHADVQVVVVRGNHDAASRMQRQLRLPDNVRVLSHLRPETLVFESLGLAIHGQSFGRRDVTDDLAAGYPPAHEGLCNVGLLHTALTGRPGHESYAPTHLDVLKARGYDYWALGHVHAREVVSRDPWVVFPGNLQGRHAREPGEKGATLVEVNSGQVTSVEHRTLDAVRWCALELDLGGVTGIDGALELVRERLAQEAQRAGGRTLAVRLTLVGESDAAPRLLADSERFIEELRAAANDVAEDAVWIEKVRLDVRAPLDLATLAGRDDALGQLARALAELRSDPAALTELGAELAPLASKLPRAALDGPDAVRPDDVDYLGRTLAEVEQLLFARLLSTPESGS